ncbi:MAG TPA: transglycosylase SLT domain-containing protein [Steroidobacteraceae bacterium]
MRRVLRWFWAATLAACVASATSAQQSSPQAAAPAAPATARDSAADRALSVALKPWKGDFNQMRERRVVRVLAPYSRTLFFNNKGEEDGLTVDTVRDFERYINKKYPNDKRPITVVIVPTTRDKLFTQLNAGLGDIAAGNLTVTESRLKQVDFFAPAKQKLREELVVTGPAAPPLKTLADLSGKTVAVRPSSSQFESLTALNARFAAERRPPIKLQRLPDALENEDILEMTNAGVLGIVVVSDWEADLWSQLLPNLKVHPDLAVRKDARIGWAFRKGSPQLQAAIADFNSTHLEKQGVTAYRIAQFKKNFRKVLNPTQGEDVKRFESTLDLFRKYGKQYEFDPLMLAAQGYQESRLDQGAKSQVGAIGVMQIMPATGKELGVGDIRTVEANIHGGAKYMDQLMERYFKDARFDAQNRSLFAFAAYNAGPGRIQQMRTLAKTRGLDPDQWFNNVEIVTAEKVGIETTTYVRNIYKYYVSYRLLLEAQETRRKAKAQVASGKT